MVPHVCCKVLSFPSTVVSHLCCHLCSFSVSYIVLTFQEPILVLVLALKTSIFPSVASSRLPPLSFIRVSSDDSRRPSHSVESISSLAVSVTGVFLRNRIVSPVCNPQPGGPVDHASSGLYLSTCLAWEALPGDESPASIALGVTETRKPTDRDKVTILR